MLLKICVPIGFWLKGKADLGESGRLVGGAGAEGQTWDMNLSGTMLPSSPRRWSFASSRARQRDFARRAQLGWAGLGCVRLKMSLGMYQFSLGCWQDAFW